MAKLGAIVLDPGHGGTKTVGGSSPNNATSISGVKEKTLALDFCKILKAELEKQATAAGDQVDVVLTRTTDVNVGITARANKAGANNAKLFLSLHFNGLDKASVRGVETFYADKLNGNTNEAADKAFAGKMHAALLAGMRSIDPATPDRTLKSDRLTGPKKLGTLNDVALGNSGKARKCLAAYFEVEFLTNPAVEALLVSGPSAAANRTKVMASVAKAMLAQIRTMP
jgi:N-acetylmuramoyl-L-alanine amidase